MISETNIIQMMFFLGVFYVLTFNSQNEFILLKKSVPEFLSYFQL